MSLADITRMDFLGHWYFLMACHWRPLRWDLSQHSWGPGGSCDRVICSRAFGGLLRFRLGSAQFALRIATTLLSREMVSIKHWWINLPWESHIGKSSERTVFLLLIITYLQNCTTSLGVQTGATAHNLRTSGFDATCINEQLVWQIEGCSWMQDFYTFHLSCKSDSRRFRTSVTRD